MTRSAWTASRPGEAILVIDEFCETNPTMTVTNDAEAVVKYAVASFGDHRIAYRDTDGRWDELKHDGGSFTGFAPLDAELRREVEQYA